MRQVRGWYLQSTLRRRCAGCKPSSLWIDMDASGCIARVSMGKQLRESAGDGLADATLFYSAAVTDQAFCLGSRPRCRA